MAQGCHYLTTTSWGSNGLASWLNGLYSGVLGWYDTDGCFYSKSLVRERIHDTVVDVVF